MSSYAALATLITCALVVSRARPAAAQELISAGDVMALPAPEADHRIRYGEDPLHFADLYLPDGPGPHPVVAFVHGGCWLAPYDISYTAPMARAIAEAGYAVWNVEYRRVGNVGGGWPGTFQDVGRAVDHLREVAQEHELDLERVVAAGHSAGGQLALWLAARGRVAADSPVHSDDPLPIGAVFAMAAAADMEGLAAAGTCDDAVVRLMGGSPAQHPTRYAAVSPMRLTPIDVPQTLVVGLLDATWTPPARAYHQRALDAGSANVRVVELPESGHFEMVVPTTSSWPAVLAALMETFEEIGR